jgi:hypothetical protein
MIAWPGGQAPAMIPHPAAAGNFRQFSFTVLWQQASLNDRGGHGMEEESA